MKMSALSLVDMFVVVLCDILCERVCVFWEALATHGIIIRSAGHRRQADHLARCWQRVCAANMPRARDSCTRSNTHPRCCGAARLQALQHQGLLFAAALLKQSHATHQVEKVQIVTSSSLLLFWLSSWPHLTPRCPLTPMRRFAFTQTSGCIHIIAVLLQKQGSGVMWLQCQRWKS